MFRSLLARLRATTHTRFGLPALILAGVVLVISGLIASRPRLQPLAKPERVWPVEAVVAKHQTLQPELELFGEVVAGRHSELRALVAGPIVRVGANFRDGGAVKKGELLIEIDPFDYRTGLADQRSKLKEAEVRLEVLRRDLKRAQDLIDRKLVSEQFLEKARLDVEQQEAVVEQRRIAVERAEKDLAETRLTAPFDGVVNDVNANLGKQLSTNDKVADLIDASELEVRFSLSNAQYGRLLDSGEAVIGRPVKVLWQVGQEQLAYDGTIRRVGAEIAATTGGVDAYAVIAAAGRQLPLRPGAFVSVQVTDRRYENVLHAPESAIYGENTVYVVLDERLQERRVRIEGYAGNDVLFTSAGDPAIRDGDVILTTQLREIGTGVKVAVRQ
jgi:RND family efflux transporter MFP subunit